MIDTLDSLLNFLADMNASVSQSELTEMHKVCMKMHGNYSVCDFYISPLVLGGVSINGKLTLVS